MQLWLHAVARGYTPLQAPAQALCAMGEKRVCHLIMVYRYASFCFYLFKYVEKRFKQVRSAPASTALT